MHLCLDEIELGGGEKKKKKKKAYKRLQWQTLLQACQSSEEHPINHKW